MQAKFKRLAWLMVLAAGMGTQATANAGAVTLYNTLDDGSNGIYFNIGSTSSQTAINFGESVWAANQFSTDGLCPNGCSLGDITLSLKTLDGNTPVSGSNLSLQVYTNDPNAGGYDFSIFGWNPNLPGQGTAQGAPLPLTPSGSVGNVLFGEYTFSASAPITLDDNTTYWVELINNSASSDLLWEYAVTGTPGLSRALTGFGPMNNTTPFMMSVEATQLSAVPIPGAIWLMGSALIGLVVQGRRSKSRV